MESGTVERAVLVQHSGVGNMRSGAGSVGEDSSRMVLRSIDRMASPSPNVSYTVCSPIDIVALMPRNNVQYLHDTAGPGSDADRADRDQKSSVNVAFKPSQVVHGGSSRHRLYMVVWVVQV